MANKVNGIDDLEQMRAAAASQGGEVPNYQEWSKILKDLAEAGVESTGSYSGDKAKINEIETTVQAFIRQTQAEQAQQAVQKQQQSSVDQTTAGSNDPDNKKDQALKATVANATSSMIMADYMKYYHLM